MVERCMGWTFSHVWRGSVYADRSGWGRPLRDSPNQSPAETESLGVVALASANLIAFSGRDLDGVPAPIVAGRWLEGQQVAMHQIFRHLLEDGADIAQLPHHERPSARGARH